MYTHVLVCKGYGHNIPVQLIRSFGLLANSGCTFPLVVLELTDEKNPKTSRDPQFTVVLAQVKNVLGFFHKIKCYGTVSLQCSDCLDLSLSS